MDNLFQERFVLSSSDKDDAMGIASVVLNEKETELYRGNGFAIASVKVNAIDKFYYLDQFEMSKDIIDMLGKVDDGEFYLGYVAEEILSSTSAMFRFLRVAPFPHKNEKAWADLERLHNDISNGVIRSYQGFIDLVNSLPVGPPQLTEGKGGDDSLNT